MRLGLLAVGLSLGLALANVADAQPAISVAETPAPVEATPVESSSRRPIALGLIAALFLVMGALAVVNDKYHDHGKPKSRRH
jgi:hypothetical protein